MKSRSALATLSSASPSPRLYAGVAEVALLRRTPRTAHVFDYAVPAGLALAPGDLVQVPFRSQVVAGVVARLKQRSRRAVGIRAVQELRRRCFITPHQLALCAKVSRHYGVSLGAALMQACPVLPRAEAAHELPRVEHTRTVRTAANIVCYDELRQREAVVRELVERVRRRGRQVLLLVPEVRELEVWRGRLGARVLTWRSDLPVTYLRAARERVQRGDAPIVVGTRAALFLPFCNLGGIIADGAESESYKQYDQNPRYDSLEVAGWLSQLWGVGLTLLSPAPPLTAWHEAAQPRATARWRYLRGRPAPVELINLERDRSSGQLLGAQLERAAGKTLARGGRVFLYLNRRGGATAVLCRDCGYSPACPTCARPLAHAGGHDLACYHCGTTGSLPLPCPACGGTSLAFTGAGVAELERQARTLWPRVSIARCEGEHATTDPRTPLVVGTQAALRLLDWRTFALAAMVAPDRELMVPEFRAAEELWATARRLATGGAERVLVQTQRPNHHVWQALVTGDVAKFYHDEVKVRTQFSYPPAVGLVRLTAQAVSAPAALALARRTRQALEPHLSPSAELRGPYADYFRQVRGRFRFHVLLRYPRRRYEPARLWPYLPEEVLIDRHPWSILS